MKFLFNFLLFLISLTSFNQEILFECGQNSGQNFNGWYIHPYQVIDDIEFDAQSVSFFSENGGNYTLSLQRKIEGLETLSEFSLLFNFEGTLHSEIRYVTYYVSTDGENWRPIEESQNNVVCAVNNEDFQFVKAEASVQFFENGKVTCDYVKIENTEPGATTLTTLPPEEEEADLFFIFEHDHKLNIETQSEAPYEVLITSINGQIVFRETYFGSERIDLPADYAGIYVVTIIYENDFAASKKVIL